MDWLTIGVWTLNIIGVSIWLILVLNISDIKERLYELTRLQGLSGRVESIDSNLYTLRQELEISLEKINIKLHNINVTVTKSDYIEQPLESIKDRLNQIDMSLNNK
jgi:predicted phage tail protein